MTFFKIIIPFFLLSFLIACTDDENKNKKELSGDHIWKEQTDTLKTSKDVAKQLQQSLDQQKQKLDESN